jgi:hypothetical protein
MRHGRSRPGTDACKATGGCVASPHDISRTDVERLRAVNIAAQRHSRA